MNNKRLKYMPVVGAIATLCLAWFCCEYFSKVQSFQRDITTTAQKGSDNLLCPSEYPTAEEAGAGFGRFSDEFYAAHPDASIKDLIKARVDFYVTHHCTEELKRYQQAASGQGDKATMDMINSDLRRTSRN